LAVRILGTCDEDLRRRMEEFQQSLGDIARGKDADLQARLGGAGGQGTMEG
jgi:phosphoribosylcarboxyaminoimidazole (NCAIR) mutase